MVPVYNLLVNSITASPRGISLDFRLPLAKYFPLRLSLVTVNHTSRW